MNREEYEKFSEPLPPQESLFYADGLRDQRSRTLLYGCLSHTDDCRHDTFHVYLADGRLHVIQYNHADNIVEYHGQRTLLPRAVMLPSKPSGYLKRLYPEACDAECCSILYNNLRWSLPFTTFNPDRLPALFHGKVHPDHKHLAEPAKMFNSLKQATHA